NILKELTKTLYLDKPPIRIEIYDNSHFSGSNMIGVMVVASNTGFIKNQYRKFNIRNEINNFKKKMFFRHWFFLPVLYHLL
ncbi:MAG: hypothetical protein HN597_19420, partial [Desulfobacula sp.]|uniref:hypothetical protein n=1 Tax=Desulfobacula sp. TaxID=2593537 RepID=UPI0039B93435|nr:hypothetical protein [Desulfobacula sp.]